MNHPGTLGDKRTAKKGFSSKFNHSSDMVPEGFTRYIFFRNMLAASNMSMNGKYHFSEREYVPEFISESGSLSAFSFIDYLRSRNKPIDIKIGMDSISDIYSLVTILTDDLEFSSDPETMYDMLISSSADPNLRHASDLILKAEGTFRIANGHRLHGGNARFLFNYQAEKYCYNLKKYGFENPDKMINANLEGAVIELYVPKLNILPKVL